MFPQTFDQPFDLVITSTECSPIVFNQSNSSNEIRVSFKSRVTVSIENPLDNVSGSLDSTSNPKNSGKENDRNVELASTSSIGTCSPPTSHELKASTSVTNGVSMSPGQCNKQNNRSGCDKNKCNDKPSLEDIPTTTADTNEDFDSEIELVDRDSDTTSSDPFTSSEDETVTKKRPKSVSRKILFPAVERENSVDLNDDDYLLKVQTKVHVVRLTDPVAISNESASNLDKIYSQQSENLFKNKLDYVHRYVPSLKKADESDQDSLPSNDKSDDESDDDPFPFNRPSSLQKSKNDLPLTTPLNASRPFLNLDSGEEQDLGAIRNPDDSAHDIPSAMQVSSEKRKSRSFDKNDKKRKRVIIQSSSDSEDLAEESDLSDVQLQEDDEAADDVHKEGNGLAARRKEKLKLKNEISSKLTNKMTNRRNFKRRRLNYNLPFYLFKSKINLKFGKIANSKKHNRCTTCQQSMNKEPFLSRTVDINNSDESNQLTTRGIDNQQSEQTESLPLDSGAETFVKDADKRPTEPIDMVMDCSDLSVASKNTNSLPVKTELLILCDDHRSSGLAETSQVIGTEINMQIEDRSFDAVVTCTDLVQAESESGALVPLNTDSSLPSKSNCTVSIESRREADRDVNIQKEDSSIDDLPASTNIIATRRSSILSEPMNSEPLLSSSVHSSNNSIETIRLAGGEISSQSETLSFDSGAAIKDEDKLSTEWLDKDQRVPVEETPIDAMTCSDMIRDESEISTSVPQEPDLNSAKATMSIEIIGSYATVEPVKVHDDLESIEIQKVPKMTEITEEAINDKDSLSHASKTVDHVSENMETVITTLVEPVEDEPIKEVVTSTDIVSAETGSSAEIPMNMEPCLSSSQHSCNDAAKLNPLVAQSSHVNMQIVDTSLDTMTVRTDNSAGSGSTVEVSRESNLNNTKVMTPQRKTTTVNNLRIPEIAKVLSLAELEDESIKAINDERERMERLIEQEKKFNHLRSMMDKNQEKLILDFEDNGNVRVEVNSLLLKVLKTHQRDGIKFMYNSTIENVDRLKEGDKGSGCILAHCMGLGKTLQAIAFIHTLFSSPSTRYHIKTILIAVPVNVLENWKKEFFDWVSMRNLQTFNIFEMSNKSPIEFRSEKLRLWQKKGGVLIIGHTLLGSLCDKKKNSTLDSGLAFKHLVDPGPDMILIDEGHILKSSTNQLNKIVASMRTRRKILLTGTPLQNNLVEYYTMIDIIKPRLLGTSKGFANFFQTPIAKGQKADSTSEDFRIMKERESVLHQLLSGSIQRYNFDTLRPFLQPKVECALFICPTKMISKMYNHFLDHVCKEKRVLVHSVYLRFCVNHPAIYHLRNIKDKQKERISRADPLEPKLDDTFDKDWYKQFIGMFVQSGHLNEYHANFIGASGKFVMFFKILQKCISVGDKLVVASQSIETLDLIAMLLRPFEQQFGNRMNRLQWVFGRHYFRIDGSKSLLERYQQIERFNDPKNKEARLFLLSTKAGGIGINLHGANRVIIFDVSWNPSDDIQAICRVYRMGQTKPVYVYRFVTKDTMEEQIFRKQIVKLGMAIRVVDQQQVERIFTTSELNEFYDTRPKAEYEISNISEPQPDHLLSDLLSAENKEVMSCIELDSLLEKKPEEDLTELERQLAWKEYHIERESVTTGDQQDSLLAQKQGQNSTSTEVMNNSQNNYEPILDSDQTVRVDVPRILVEMLKPHQIEGIKFMYNSTIGNVDKLTKRDRGSGCILAHCMGSGKSWQVITFIHTLLSCPYTEEYIKTVLIVVPVNMIEIWKQEFDKCLKSLRTFEIYEINESTIMKTRISRLDRWRKNRGVLIIGHETLTNLLNFGNNPRKKISTSNKRLIEKRIFYPGPNLVIIDECHKFLSRPQNRTIIRRMQTQRKILLTGIPLQNNLYQYFIMMHTIKPHLLGSSVEFTTKFLNPIEKGQKIGSSSVERELMKKKEDELDQLLDDSTQKFGYQTLRTSLPFKVEHALIIHPTKLMAKMYNHFLSRVNDRNNHLVHAWYLQNLVNHPALYYLQCSRGNTRRTASVEPREIFKTSLKDDWFKQFVKPDDVKNSELSNKFIVMLNIIRECVSQKQKLVIASQSNDTLDLIQDLLIDRKWIIGKNLFRIGALLSSIKIQEQTNKFNDSDYGETQICLLSTKAGIAINLTGASRIIIFDVSWDSNDDIYAICRLYRMGQTKPVYVYRLVTKDTMEEQLFIKQMNKRGTGIRAINQQQVEDLFTTSERNEFYETLLLSEYHCSILNEPKDRLLAKAIRNTTAVLRLLKIDSIVEKNANTESIEDETKITLDKYQKLREVEMENRKKKLDILRLITPVSQAHENASNSMPPINPIEQEDSVMIVD